MFGIGGGEILVVAIVALLLFGNEDLPKNMRKMVKAWNDFRGVTNDLQRSWLDVRDQVARDIMTDRPESQQSDTHTTDSAAQVTGSDDSKSPLPPPEGLHDGAFGQPVIQPAQGSLAQGHLVESEAEPMVANPSSTSTNSAEQAVAGEKNVSLQSADSSTTQVGQNSLNDKST